VGIFEGIYWLCWVVTLYGFVPFQFIDLLGGEC
jgi:hypothetical protein